MKELLAVPAWDTPPTTLDAWTKTLADLGHPPKLRREDGDAWLEIDALRLRGYVVQEDANVTAINFEMYAPDPAEAADLLARASEALRWELHEDDGSEEDDDDD